METTQMTPEKSLALIQRMINEARLKFEENGFIYLFWGILVALSSFGQYLLLRNGYFDIHYFPYFLMPLGGVYTWYYYAHRRQLHDGERKMVVRNQIGSIVSYCWVAIALNLLVLGFFFSSLLNAMLIPVLLILMSVGILISGTAIKSRLLIFSGVLINLSGFVAFFVPRIYQPLLMGIVAICTMFIPGVMLMMRYKRRSHV